MQLPSLPAAVSASLPAAEGVTMEVTVTLEFSSASQENVPVKLVESVLRVERVAEMSAFEGVVHPTSGRCSAYPIGCSHEWLLLVSSPHHLYEYQARASPNPGTPAPCQLLCI